MYVRRRDPPPVPPASLGALSSLSLPGVRRQVAVTRTCRPRAPPPIAPTDWRADAHPGSRYGPLSPGHESTWCPDTMSGRWLPPPARSKTTAPSREDGKRIHDLRLPYIRTYPIIQTCPTGRSPGLRLAASLLPGPWPVTAVLAAASVTMGLVLGWWITAVIAAAVISYSQERAQRKVRYWQAETARARAIADRLTREAAAREKLPSECEGWPPAR
jgi:hypothetical protein